MFIYIVQELQFWIRICNLPDYKEFVESGPEI